FNRWLKERMELGDLHRLLRGDIAKKTDTGGLFEVEDEIVDTGRLARREVVPTGPLLGGRVRWASGIPGDRERALLVTTKVGEDQLRRNRLNGDRRRALIWPGALVVSRPESDQLVFEFSLPKGSYATTVLREFMKSSSTSSSLDDR
ncbi:MAG: tRNA pseudouridine(13) synthase TruD, partial [Planctomycetes bacterium]|nr:tRNA pseudouridine(13) synthase TruD [Planctomycetota bacterium]